MRVPSRTIVNGSALLALLFGGMGPIVAFQSDAARPGPAAEISAERMRTLKAGSGEVVSVTATVCYQDPLWKFLFLTDEGHGIFANPVPGTYEVGQRLKITGPVGNGHGVPIFHENIVVEEVGEVELPDPQQADLVDWDWDHGFADPRNTGWVELEGEVKQVVLVDNSTRLWCQGSDRLFPVTIAEPLDPQSAWELSGARIRVRGALGNSVEPPGQNSRPVAVNATPSLCRNR